MGNSFGGSFVLVNDIRQILNRKIFKGGPFLHMATVKRGLREYMCFKDMKTGQTYIERIDWTEPAFFLKIEDQQEWKDLADFLADAGILKDGKDHYFKMHGV